MLIDSWTMTSRLRAVIIILSVPSFFFALSLVEKLFGGLLAFDRDYHIDLPHLDFMEELDKLPRICKKLETLVNEEGDDQYSSDIKERCDFLISQLAPLYEAVSYSPEGREGYRMDLRKLAFSIHLQELQFFIYAHQLKAQEPRNLKLMDEPAQIGLRRIVASLQRNVDESPLKQEKLKISDELSDKLFQYLDRLQNHEFTNDFPEAKDNQSANQKRRMLVCSSATATIGGFTFRSSIAIWCLAGAVASNRTLILQEPDGFLLMDHVSKPVYPAIDERSHDELRRNLNVFPGRPMDEEVLMDTKKIFNHMVLSLIRSLGYMMPPHIPPQFDPHHQLPLIAEIPPSWYMGQLSNYMMRPQERVMTEFRRRAAVFKIHVDYRGRLEDKSHITAGIHVRRGNKIEDKEAPPHPLWKFMFTVEEMYRKYEVWLGRKLERRVFVATDNTKILDQAKKEFSHYTILSNSTVAHFALGNESVCYNYKNTDAGGTLENIVIDMLLLANVDFVVNTISSNVGRFFSTMRMAQNPASSASTTISLDMEWYFERMIHSNHYVALQDHTATQPNELSFSKGDVIHSMHRSRLVKERFALPHMFNKLADGISYGVNKNQSEFKIGVYPRFKAKLIEDDWLN